MFRKDFIEKAFPGAVIFMSGSGTNAEKLLESHACGTLWDCRAIVTDRPGNSRAEEIAKKYSVPLVAHDIFQFYAAHGLTGIGIGTEKGFAVRKLWTEALREKLSGIDFQFGILAGFIPLTNIVADFPCLNVHPGDLTVEKDGVRIFAGLHAKPVERAVLEGFSFLRSSVILATPFTPGAKEMDGGHVLGVSAEIPILPRGEKESAESFLKKNLENLKRNGDWILFPSVVEDFASGRFSEDTGKNLLWKNDSGVWEKIRTIEYLGEIRKARY